METIRIAIADDQQLFLDGIAALLGACPEVEVVATANSGEEAVTAVDNTQPEILLLDLSMPEVDGLAVLERLAKLTHQPKVIMLTVHEDLSLIQDCLKHGAMGYILKINGKDELLRAILDVASGRRYLDPNVMEILIGQSGDISATTTKSSPANAPLLLTSREQEVLRCLSEGKTSGEIAEQLYISTNTVDTHRKNIIAKLGARNITDAVRLALQQGLMEN